MEDIRNMTNILYHCDLGAADKYKLRETKITAVDILQEKWWARKDTNN